MNVLRLRTQRLELISSTLEHVRAEIDERTKLERMLNASIPGSWPPPLNDIDSLNHLLRWYAANPDQPGWTHWYVILCEPRPGAADLRTLVANVGLTGLPNANGVVEIGYSVLPEFQRRGVASEASTALINWAFDHPAVRLVAAETMPELIPSIRTAERLGFSFAGPGREPGTICFHLPRAAWPRPSG